MKKEEIEKLINERIETENYYNKWEAVLFGFFALLVFILIFWWICCWRHNSDVDYHNEQLQFCKDIYNSDNVVLEQCQNYFVIVEKGSDK